LRARELIIITGGLAGPEIVDVDGSHGPLLPQNPLEKVGAFSPYLLETHKIKIQRTTHQKKNKIQRTTHPKKSHQKSSKSHLMTFGRVV
jgi:hypothetical protein